MSLKSVLSDIVRGLSRQERLSAELNRKIVNNPLNAGGASSQTIAAGAISVTRPHVVVLPESGTADNLDEINNFSDGKFILISTADVGDTITVRDESVSGGNIALRGVTSRVLSDPEDSLLLIYKESVGFWIQAGGTPAGGVPAAHASTHQHSGTDEVATATPAANAIPKADASGTLNDWVTVAASDIATAIDGATEQTAPEDANRFPLTDTGVLKWISYLNLFTAIRDAVKTYYDSVVATLTNKSISGATNTVTALPTSAHDDNSITYAKMQDIATDSLIGRDTASTGDPETISLNATLSMTGAGALQRAALTGDVTASAGSNATTIANDAVTFAKMQNIATDSVLGRATAGTGDIELITLTAFARTLIDDVAASNARTTLGLGTAAVENSVDLVHIAGTETITGAKTFEAAVVIGLGNSLTLTDPDVAHGMITNLPTDAYGRIGEISGLDGGVQFDAASDADSIALLIRGLIGVTDPTDTTPAVLFRSGKKSGTTFTALAAAETVAAFDNNVTRLLRLLGNGDLIMVSGAALTAETIKAVDADGVRIQDDGNNAYILLKNNGEVEIRRDSTGNLITFSSDTLTESGNVFVTGVLRESDASVRFGIILPGATSAMLYSGVVGDSFRRFLIQTDGKLLWGSGSATRDTNLYRSAADTLKTDDAFVVGATLNVTGVVDFTDFFHWAGLKRVSTQFDKTDTTLANVTGLSVNVKAGTAYKFSAILFVDANASGGHKVAISGTATATSVIYNITYTNSGSGAFILSNRQTALGGTITQIGATSVFATIEGTIVVNAAGTLTVQFAQASAAGTSSVLVNSTFEVMEMA